MPDCGASPPSPSPSPPAARRERGFFAVVRSSAALPDGWRGLRQCPPRRYHCVQLSMLKKTLLLLLLGVAPGLLGAQRAKTSAKATPVPTPIPTPVAPERVPSSARKGAAPEKRVGPYQNPNVSFSKLTRVDEVDLDNDGVFEALVEGIGTVRSLPPDIPAVGFVSRTRLPFENPICAVFKRGRGTDWDVLLLAHLPQRCRQSDDPARCDQLLAFRAVEFRYDDRPQVALQIAHAGEARLTETSTYRLDRDRLETTFSAAGPRNGLDVAFGPGRHRPPDRRRHLHQQGAAAALPELHAGVELRVRRAPVPDRERDRRARVGRAGRPRAVVLGPRPPVDVRVGPDAAAGTPAPRRRRGAVVPGPGRAREETVRGRARRPHRRPSTPGSRSSTSSASGARPTSCSTSPCARRRGRRASGTSPSSARRRSPRTSA